MLFLETTCPICGTGARGFRLCDDQSTVVVMCDECDSLWLDAGRLDQLDVVYAEPPEFRVPGLSCSIAKSRWATRAEVESAGWGDLVAGEGVALDGG